MTRPLSCCDAADLIDLKQIRFDEVVNLFASASELSVQTFALLSRPFSMVSMTSFGFRWDATMDDFVDHLRLPASPHLGLNLADPHLWTTIFFIVFNPLFWNVLARLEHRKRILTRLCFGRSKLACALLGCVIIILGLWRDHQFNLACHTQPSWIALRQNRVLILGYLSCVFGSLFVLLSFYQLGFYSTFLGDYFGIFPHSSPVASFPFSVCSDPMYFGSFLNFLGLALVKSSPAGILLSLLVALVYRIALSAETPFMTAIYAEKLERKTGVEEEEGGEEGEEEEEEEQGLGLREKLE